MLVSTLNLPRRFGKTLLVCSQRCSEVERYLANAGCLLTKVRDGNRALCKIREEFFDTAILLSTGKQMDLVETILNLRDIRPAMAMIVLIDSSNSDPNAGARAIIARAIPEIPIFTVTEFQTRLDSIDGNENRHKATRR